MVISLPSDVLLLVCEELGKRLDFKTLYNSALSSKSLARPALIWMYRIHDQSDYIKNEEGDSELPEAPALEPGYAFFSGAPRQTLKPGFAISKVLSKQYKMRWALLWKSLIRSSMGKTAYPYCLYIRSFDLRNLEYLLDDSQFRETAMQDFFADEMASLCQTKGTTTQKKTRKGKALQVQLNTPLIIELIGELITTYVSEAAYRDKATVALEDIAGSISSIALPKFTSRVPRLKSLTLYDGAVLNGEVASALSEHCPYFDDLTYCFFRTEDDTELAAFFGGLRPNSLKSFTAVSANGIGPKTLLAINHHSSSLTTLKLNGLEPDAVKNLSLLQGCKILEVLEIHDSNGLINLETTENDVFLEVLDWLGRCDRLREVEFGRLQNAPAILTHVCLQNNIRLKKLALLGYQLDSNQTFHQALSQQTSLDSLLLKADAEDAFRDDIDTLVSAISQLKNLKELDIFDTSDGFKSSEIKQIATNLPKLERLSFSGYEITDDIWPSIAGLHQLRAFSTLAFSSFTLDGLLNYISTLQPSNQGLSLTVMNQNREYDIEDSEKTILQDSIRAKVGGKFELQLYRDESDLESLSD